MNAVLLEKQWALFLSTVLICSMFTLIGTETNHANAAGTGQAIIKMLEITENGASDISELTNSNYKLEVTTYSMKQFVASRDDVDGKYDAVYIGKGAYSIALPYKELNTGSKQNDITSLKASEINNFFVKKGLPVIVYNDSSSGALHQSSSGKLYQFVTSIQGKTNVSFVNSTEIKNAAAFAAKASLLTKGTLRPKLTITSMPDEYPATTKIYTRGETITYNYNISNAGDLANQSLLVNLYINTDSALPYTNEHIVASKPVTSLSGTLSYTLPKGYSEPKFWRLELVDSDSGLKDIKSGWFRFKDQVKKIKVLQFRGNNSGNDSGLDKDHNFDSSYLVRSGDYEITFKALGINDFNAPANYQKLQDYDMLLFGFAHEYKEFAFIEVQGARDALTNYIRSGKSVVFTHDTFNPYSREGVRSAYWNLFKGYAGMIEPSHDMGYVNNSNTTTTKKINSGLLTQFPYTLADNVEVMTTHNQYYTLDLEDPSVIPWYNLSGGGRTDGDSWNHYYTYSKDNITFTGSGHSGQTTNGYTEAEKRLFVNTMYRAFSGANHGPEITVFAPAAYNQANDNFIPSFEEIPVHYQVDDLDMHDTELTTSIHFIYNGATYSKLSNQGILSGSTINMSFPNPLPNGGDLIVEITAKDSKGAESKVQIPVRVKKIASNLELSRSFSDNVVDNKVDTGSTVTFNYKITPKAISGSGSMMISNVQFKEQLPPQLEIISLPANLTKSGNVATGYIIAGSLGNIQYSKSDALYTADPITFSFTAKPLVRGFYPLNEAALTFKDIGQTANTRLPFPAYTLEAVTKLTSLRLEDATLLVGDSQRLLPIYTPADLTDVPFKWESDAPGIVSVDSTGYITGNVEGTANVTVKALDGSGKEATAKITVIKPGLHIIGPNEVAAGDSIILNSSLRTANYEQITSYSWSISAGSSFISMTPVNNRFTTVNGTAAGEATVKLIVSTNLGNTYTAEAPVQVYQPKPVITGPSSVELGEKFDLTAEMTSRATDPIVSYHWEIVDGASNVTVLSQTSDSNLKLRSKIKGTVTLKVQITTSSHKTFESDPLEITIKPVTLQLPDIIRLHAGQTKDLFDSLASSPRAGKSNIRDSLVWSSSNDEIVQVDANGIITAIKTGSAKITVAYRHDPAIKAETTIIVNYSMTTDGGKY